MIHHFHGIKLIFFKWVVEVLSDVSVFCPLYLFLLPMFSLLLSQSALEMSPNMKRDEEMHVPCPNEGFLFSNKILVFSEQVLGTLANRSTNRGMCRACTLDP